MLVLYRFRHKNQFGKWVMARYRAELDVIRAQHPEIEIVGEPEEREPSTGSFSPFAKEGER